MRFRTVHLNVHTIARVFAEYQISVASQSCAQLFETHLAVDFIPVTDCVETC